ncbi:MAG: response regulator [Chloroflexi bacterium]|nr:response regulator [Chloroflexota bacterium]
MDDELARTKGKILVADDDPAIRALLDEALTLAGYAVWPACDGEEALEQVHAALPSLLILDLVLPRLDGYGVLERLREDESHRDLPVIVLTAHGSRADAAVALEKGADDFLAKPVDLDELLLRIEVALKRHPNHHTVEDSRTRLQVCLFGPMRVCAGEANCIDEEFTRRKAKALFGYLYLHRGRMISKDELMEALWPEDDDPNFGRIKQLVMVLRHALEPGRPCGSAPRYILERGGYYYFNNKLDYCSDVEEFERRVALARAHQDKGDIDAALEEYLKAIALRTGEFLDEFRYEDWATLERARLKEMYLDTLENAATLLAAGRNYAEAVRLLRLAIAEDRVRESSYVELMRFLWQDGKRSEALRTYERLKEVLADQLQVDPDPEVTKLYHAIRQDE